MEEGCARLNTTSFFKVMSDNNWKVKLRLSSGIVPDLQSHDVIKLRVLYVRVYKVRVIITSNGACRFESGWAKFARDAKLSRGEYVIFNQIMKNEYRRLPSEFASKYEATLARDSITLETDYADRRWVMQLARRRGHIFFKEGWSSFIQDNRFAEGDLFTVKVYVGLNKWKVSIYDSCGWRKISTRVANTGSAPNSNPAIADRGLSSLVNVGLRFVRKFPKYALRTNLELPKSIGLAMDRSGGRTVKLTNSAGSQWEVELRDRDNNVGRRYYLAAGGWTEFCRMNYVRSGNILLFTLVRTSDPIIRVKLVESVQGKQLLGEAPRGGLI